MAQGLIEQKMVPPQAPAAPAAQPQAPAGAPPQAGAAPDQKKVEVVVMAATKIIHDPKVRASLLKMMQTVGDPAQAIAQATYTVMKQLVVEFKQKIPPDVLGAASLYVLNLVAELGERAGLFKASPELLGQAAKIGMDLFRKEQASAQQPAGAEPAAAPAAEPATEPAPAGV